MKVKMFPSYDDVKGQSNGIARCIEGWTRHSRDFGIEYVSKDSDDFDIIAAHAGCTGKDCDVAHLHGIYFTGDYAAKGFEFKTNANVINAIRHAKAITVPSEWVAETFQRDMRVNPFVIYHGIDDDGWDIDTEDYGYIIWTKNRTYDVCQVNPLLRLAGELPSINFVSTFGDDNKQAIHNNLKVTGVIPPNEMKKLVAHCSVYLSSVKETFGIGTLEAMKLGKPILGFNYGGNKLLVEHGVNGYLAEPGNIEDLKMGLLFCLKNKDNLGHNSKILARKWKWENVMPKLFEVYSMAMKKEEPTIGVVIPCYNYASKVGRAIESVQNQTIKANEIVVVDDGSTDNIVEIMSKYPDVKLIRQQNSGVATARNNGILSTNTKYIVCLDADDAIEPLFLERCVTALEKNNSIGIAYTKLRFIKPNGETGVSQWPDSFDYDMQLKRKNQIPTCCMFRREMFDRLGGYRDRYSPNGAGCEDAEFFLRAGAYGYGAELVTNEPLFVYSWMSGIVSGNKEYKESDWTILHPWTKDNQHPFASIAKPLNGFSHPVRQYDEPIISAIIPVGPGHEKELHNVLDSLEAQEFRKWEAIIVWDSEKPIDEYYLKAYPYIKLLHTPRAKSGPGVGRNLGAKNARGRFLVFIDADDWLYPGAFGKFIEYWNQYGSIIYSDYVGKSYTLSENLHIFGDKLLRYNEKTKETIVLHNSSDYDCQRAQRQPDMDRRDLYHWCLVTCLIPKEWHDEIGGFDESMDSWEDVDYHWRMARAGKCYERIKEPLVVYRFATGNRREFALPENDGGIVARKLLNYMKKKYERIENKMCVGCGKPVDHPTVKQIADENKMIADEDFVEVIHVSTNTGDHPLVGAVTGIDYGYRSNGDKILVNKADIDAMPDSFRKVVVVQEQQVVIQQSKESKISDLINAEVRRIDESQIITTSAPDVLEKKSRGRPKKNG